MAKTIFSIPTHLRNFFSAGAFAGANGILFEGLTNPGLLKKAFAEGIDTSALLKLGPGSAEAQAAYRELLELGVVNSQVQIGDLIGLLKTATGDPGVASTDTILRPFMSKLKKLGDYGCDGDNIPDPYFFEGFEGFEKVYDMIEICTINLVDKELM